MAAPVFNTLIGGAFTDALGNALANGYLLFTLSDDSDQGGSSADTLVCAGFTVRVPLDVNGNVVGSLTTPTFTLWTNDQLDTGTFYTVEAYTSQGELVWGPNSQTILSTPTPYNISAWTPGRV